MRLSLKFDLRAPDFGAPPAQLYRAAVEMCEWADANGFHTVRFLEHHGSADRYCPAPLAMAAAVSTRTRHVRIRARAFILPLHDAGGYVASEFAMFGRELRERPSLLDEGVQALRAAWTGQPFVYRGRPALVALTPIQRPGPPIAVGGSSEAAARRAARIGDGFEPTDDRLFDVYVQECLRLGVTPGPRPPSRPPGWFLHVTNDPESAWTSLGPHLVHESNSYATLLAEGGMPGAYRAVSTADDLRRERACTIIEPAECVALARTLGNDGMLEFHPLAGGADPELGWSSLHLVADEVLPVLRREGLVTDPPRH
jgi:hypothetical protein